MPYKTFRPWLPMQPTLLPTDIARWLPDKHLARFVVEIVDQLDMSPIQLKYHVKDPRGVQPYDPRMMVALLLYAYAVGVFSSRRIERATYEDVAFRVLTGNQQPDHDTIATFRREHLTEIRALFVEVLRIAGRMGLVAFGSLGLDGVKVRANASKHQAMSYDRMKTEEVRLQAEIDELLRHAEQTDSDEALRFGNGELVDIPEELALRQKRKARIQEAIAALEDEARLVRAAELREQQERHETAAADPERIASSTRPVASRRRRRSAQHRSGEPHHGPRRRPLRAGVQRPGRCHRGADHRGNRRRQPGAGRRVSSDLTRTSRLGASGIAGGSWAPTPMATSRRPVRRLTRQRRI